MKINQILYFPQIIYGHLILSLIPGKLKIKIFSIYTLSYLGVLSNLIGSLSLALSDSQSYSRKIKDKNI